MKNIIGDIKIMSEKEQFKELDKLEQKIDFEKYGKDGFLEIGRENYEYKGVKYDIAILRYYTLKPNKFTIIGNRLSDCHFVVEYPKETKELVNKIKSLDDMDFLWYDTLHIHNEKQSLEEQFNECHELAKSDIDSIPQIIMKAEKDIEKIKETIREIFVEYSLYGKLHFLEFNKKVNEK